MHTQNSPPSPLCASVCVWWAVTCKANRFLCVGKKRPCRDQCARHQANRSVTLRRALSFVLRGLKLQKRRGCQNRWTVFLVPRKGAEVSPGIKTRNMMWCQNQVKYAEEHLVRSDTTTAANSVKSSVVPQTTGVVAASTAGHLLH